MESKTLTIRIDADLYSAMKALSKKEDRSLSWICGMAIKKYLEKQKPSQSHKL